MKSLVFIWISLLYFVTKAQPPPNYSSYQCLKTTSPLSIDGLLDESAWACAAWSSPFVDIEGLQKPTPKYNTQIKMLWDQQYLYLGVQLEEEHLWATYTEPESIIFQENDFEVFIDPDGDTHQYYELEINALGTIWDLMLIKPYRDGGPAISGWDLDGLKSAVQVRGTLNDPSDLDQGWTIEMAIPLKELVQNIRKKPLPHHGTIWRINFSRVQWHLGYQKGQYAKQAHTETGKPLEEMNWVWSPQGTINMHMPEMWGFLEFLDTPCAVGLAPPAKFTLPPEERLKWELRTWYYKLRDHKRTTGSFMGLILPPNISSERTNNQFQLTQIDQLNQKWTINHEGKIWKNTRK